MGVIWGSGVMVIVGSGVGAMGWEGRAVGVTDGEDGEAAIGAWVQAANRIRKANRMADFPGNGIPRLA